MTEIIQPNVPLQQNNVLNMNHQKIQTSYQVVQLTLLLNPLLPFIPLEILHVLWGCSVVPYRNRHEKHGKRTRLFHVSPLINRLFVVIISFLFQ